MSQTSLGGKTVLIVDDEPDALTFIGSLLQRRFDCRTLMASNSLEALNLYDQYRIEIAAVIVDIMMPTINGFDLMQALRARNSEVPLVVITGLKLTPSLVDAKLNPMIDGWLEKPFKIEEFERILTNITAFNAPSELNRPLSDTSHKPTL